MKKNNGITLIALILTIVVLMILASVAINSINNDGIIKNAERAKFVDAVAKINENIELAKMNGVLEKYTNNGTIIYDKEKLIPQEYKDIFTITPDGKLVYLGNDVEEQAVLEGMNITIDTLLTNIKQLQILAEEYKASNETTDTTTQLCLQYIRRNKYNDYIWSIAAGAVNEGFATYVSQQNTPVSQYDFETAKIANSKVDFVHMCAALNAYLVNSPILPSRYCGWAGDLSTLIEQVIAKYPDPTAVQDDVLIAYAEELIGTENPISTFGLSDMLADIDAENFYNTGIDNFYETILNYYYKDNSNIHNRNNIFKANFGGPINATTNSFLNYRYVSQLIKDSTIKSIYTSNYARYNNIVATAFHNYFE